MCGWSAHPREKNWHRHVTVYLVMVIVAHPGYAYAIYSLTYITLMWSRMGDWIIIMSLQTTLVKACSLNQTSCHSPQFQIGTVTLVSQCHVLTYRQSRDRRLVYFRMGTFCCSAMWGSPCRGRPLCFGHGAVVFCHSPGATIQSTQASQWNHRVLQKKTWEKK